MTRPYKHSSGVWLWEGTNQPVTVSDAIDSGKADEGLIAAWYASEYTEYGDEYDIQDLIVNSFCCQCLEE